jgi:hypothetical protein
MSFTNDDSVQLGYISTPTTFSQQQLLFSDTSSNVTVKTNLYVGGAMFGSGTGISNINYNGLLNKPDLTIYSTSINLNSLSTSSILSINNLNST